MQDLETGRLGTPAGSFSYLAAGAQDAPLVLCLHGFPDLPRTFAPLMNQLAGAGYRVVAPWLRGYAPSVLTGPYHLDQLADDALAILDSLSPGRPAYLIGHDWGAAIAYVTAAAAPERLLGMVTMAVPHPGKFLTGFGPAQLRRSWYMLFFQLRYLADRAVTHRDFALIDKLWRTWSPGYALPGDYRDELHACLAASMPAPIEYYRAVLWPPKEAIARMKRMAQATVGVPTLSLHGGRDGCIGAEVALGQEPYFRGAFSYAELPRAGHFLQLEAPDQVARMVIDWLKRCAAAAAATAE